MLQAILLLHLPRLASRLRLSPVFRVWRQSHTLAALKEVQDPGVDRYCQECGLSTLQLLVHERAAALFAGFSGELHIIVQNVPWVFIAAVTQRCH